MNSPVTYKELVYRWRVMRHEDLPEGHKAAYRAEGINPDDLWSLIWSFKAEADALKCIADANVSKPSFWTYKLVDGGATTEIERSIW